MKKLVIAILAIMFSISTAYASNKVDISNIGIYKHSTIGACQDTNGHKYSEGTSLKFLENGNYYTVICDRKIMNSYVWEVVSVGMSSYSSKTWNDGLGCRDSNGRIYQEGAKIKKSFNSSHYTDSTYISESFVCMQKNGVYFLSVGGK